MKNLLLVLVVGLLVLASCSETSNEPTASELNDIFNEKKAEFDAITFKLNGSLKRQGEMLDAFDDNSSIELREYALSEIKKEKKYSDSLAVEQKRAGRDMESINILHSQAVN